MSIRTKLLLLLTFLTTTSLIFFLILATGLFKEDKIAYVFDSNAAYVKSLAFQVKSEIVSSKNLIKFLSHNFNYRTNNFSDTSREIFNKEANLYSVYAINASSKNDYKLVSELEKRLDNSPTYKELVPKLIAIIKEASAQEFSFRIHVKDENSSFIFATLIKSDYGDPLIFITVTKGEGLFKFVNQSQLYDSYVVNSNMQILLGNTNNEFSEFIFNQIKDKNTQGGSIEVIDPNGEAILSSFAEVGAGGLSVISNISKKAALKAVDILLIKSGLFFLIIISLAIIISVFSSKKLTKSLEELSDATQKVAEGNFDVKLSVKSKDEVGVLAKNFNFMTTEVLRLMKENVHKARMEKELETAKIVQSTLFPKNEAEFKSTKISGYFEPASECGGDWWYYFELNNKLYLIIADATGHGAPAALITSAARSAVSLLEQMPELSTVQIGQLLNKAIFETSQGKINMTTAIVCIDQNTGEVTYTNASHEKPLKIKYTGKEIKRTELGALLEGESPRLGESRESIFVESKDKLENGDILFFYTDGLTDIPNPRGQKLGERAVLNSFAKAVSKTDNTTEIINILKDDVKSFNEGSALEDDVTFFVCKFNSKALES
ncbi:MAG: SpoIIE family protein phosphatase [Oligoflexia bacterium]|nr:SpoIIE family protein phosphatase [Oligoflexia bacterium]